MRPRPDGAWSAEASKAIPPAPTLTPLGVGSSVQGSEDVREDVALGVATEEDVEVRVAREVHQRVPTGLQGVEPRERAVLTARQEAAVRRPREEGPARPVARRRRHDVLGDLV